LATGDVWVSREESCETRSGVVGCADGLCGDVCCPDGGHPRGNGDPGRAAGSGHRPEL